MQWEPLEIDNSSLSEPDGDLLGWLAAGDPPSRVDSGTKALMLAVLEDGIRSALSVRRRERFEAELWMNSRRQRSPFAFRVVCETFGLEPNAVRTAIERLRAQQYVGSRRGRRSRVRVNVRRTSLLRA